MNANPKDEPLNSETPPDQASQETSGQPPWVTDLALAFIAALLVVSAICHWSQFGDLKAYRQSYWIGVEMITMAISIFAVPINLVRAIYFVFKKQFRYAALAAGTIVFIIGAIILANWFDAATLIYAT